MWYKWSITLQKSANEKHDKWNYDEAKFALRYKEAVCFVTVQFYDVCVKRRQILTSAESCEFSISVNELL